MWQKIFKREHSFTTRFPHPAPGPSSAPFIGKADRSLLYAPGQHAPVLQPGQGQFFMGMLLEHGLYAFSFPYGLFVSSLSRDSGIQPI